MPRTWKSALAPYLAGIPRRTGFLGEGRLGLINDLRFGERGLPRMVDRCATLALERGESPAGQWPLPTLAVPQDDIARWRSRSGIAERSRLAVALAPGAVGPSKRWPTASYGLLVKRLVAEGYQVWIVGGPLEKALAGEIVGGEPAHIRDFTGDDLRTAILALGAANAVVSNDSGLLHVAAALGKPTIGIFGPTSPWHWAPLNPLAAVIQATGELACRPCHKPVCRFGHHYCMERIGVDQVARAALAALNLTEVGQPA
jgi:heptosyltransferase-2